MLKLNSTQQFRRDNSAVWAEKKPILLEGEPGFELDTGKIKIGDGVSDWNALPYFSIDSESKADADLSNISDTDFLNKGNSAGLLSTVSKSDVGLSNVINERQYSAANPPPYPVTSVNGKTGNITGLATVSNLVNGSSAGSVRTISSTPESDDYKIGVDAFAEGSSTIASGRYSHVEGYHTKATGESSHVEGYYTEATGDYSHAEGGYTKASGRYSHAEGHCAKATRDYSHAEGYYTESSGEYSHAEGHSTEASGTYCHSEGGRTVASGLYSHAEGNTTKASGFSSHAEGGGTVALGQYSHAGCSETIANDYQYTIGHNNTDIAGGSYADTSGTSFIIGNGTSNSTRSNCFRVQYNGQVFSKGAYSTSGADYAELFEWEDGNPNNEDHRGKFVALSGRKIHIAKPGEIPIGVISSTAAIIGNNHSETWQGMYLRDIWGDVLTEYKEIPAGTETTQHPAEMALDEDGNEVIVREAWEETRIIKPEFKGMIPVLNPDYNPDDTYIPRHERKEWGIVGLYGQLIVIDDGSCQVNGYCTCTEDGTATSSENGYLVIERLDDTHIRILSNFLNTQQQVDTLKEESLSTMEAVTQVYEQGVESGDTAVTSMEAITQNYELILELQATVQKLHEEIQMLKGA